MQGAVSSLSEYCLMHRWLNPRQRNYYRLKMHCDTHDKENASAFCCHFPVTTAYHREYIPCVLRPLNSSLPVSDLCIFSWNGHLDFLDLTLGHKTEASYWSKFVVAHQTFIWKTPNYIRLFMRKRNALYEKAPLLYHFESQEWSTCLDLTPHSQWKNPKLTTLNSQQTFIIMRACNVHLTRDNS